MEPELLSVWNALGCELKKFVYARTRDRALTEDILHDVFLKVQSKFHSLNDRSRAGGWIFTIARNVIVDHYRKRVPMPVSDFLPTSQEAENYNACAAGYLRQAVQALPWKYRQAIQTVDIDGIPQSQLANKLGITISGAKSRVQRARALVRKKLQEQLHLETDRYGNVIVCKCTAQACS